MPVWLVAVCLAASGNPSAATLVQAGDSIGVGVDSVSAIDHLGIAGLHVVNESAGGRTMQILFENRNELILAHHNPTAVNVLVIEAGTNDLAAGTSAIKLYADVTKRLTIWAKKARFYVIVNTILPRTDGQWDAQKEAQRKAYNGLVRSNKIKADAVNDLAGSPTVGDTTDPSSNRFYLDKLHLSSAGQLQVAHQETEIIGRIVRRPPR